MTTKDRYLTSKYFGYFTPRAQKKIGELEKLGIDKDLAVTWIESSWKDEEIYELPPEDDRDE